MEFSFQPVNIIKTVKRTVRVVIAGFVFTIAVNASATPVLECGMNFSEPLEQVIANATFTPKIPKINYDFLKAREERLSLLDLSMTAHGLKDMSEAAYDNWKNLQFKVAEIPFEKVFAQYDDSVDSFFLVLSFSSGHTIEATYYQDDDNVYFSVFSKGEIFLQNAMPKDIFFDRVNAIWSKIVNDVN